MNTTKLTLIVMVCVNAMIVQSANATFHFMQIQQVIGGVNGDTTAQAIQLRMRTTGQTFLDGTSRLVAYDATGSNPIVITTFPSPNPAGGTCREILIASDQFANTTTPSVDSAARDYGMDNLIPPSYFSAGSLTFENLSGTTIIWRLSWGNGDYSGATTGSTANDADGEYGPPFAGPLPSANEESLAYIPACPTGISTSNDVDYDVTTGGAVFTNNAGDSFVVTGSNVPTVSQWGLIVMALFIVIAGTLVVNRRNTRLVTRL